MRQQDHQVLRRYARAFLQNVDPSDQLIALNHVSHVASTLRNLYHPQSLKKALYQKSQQRFVIDAVIDRLDIMAPVRNLVQLLAHHGRVHCIETLVEILAHQQRQAAGVPSVSLSTCYTAGEKEYRALRKIFGADVHIEAKKNQRILGGFLLEVDGLLIDRSVRTYLEKFQKHWGEWLDEHQRA